MSMPEIAALLVFAYMLAGICVTRVLLLTWDRQPISTDHAAIFVIIWPLVLLFFLAIGLLFVVGAAVAGIGLAAGGKAATKPNDAKLDRQARGEDGR